LVEQHGREERAEQAERDGQERVVERPAERAPEQLVLEEGLLEVGQPDEPRIADDVVLGEGEDEGGHHRDGDPEEEAERPGGKADVALERLAARQVEAATCRQRQTLTRSRGPLGIPPREIRYFSCRTSVSLSTSSMALMLWSTPWSTGTLLSQMLA